jgi:amino acid adenylation domain-containing protein
LVRLDSPEFQQEMATQSIRRPASGVVADNLIYMMYTSGSTGTPKGVCVSHRSVLRLVIGSSFAVMSPEEVYLQLTPSSFDVSTFEIWGCLLHGGRLVMAPPNALSLGELGEFIARTQITTMWLTGGLFHQMVDGNLQGLSTVSQLLAGGEALSPPHVYKVIDSLSECKVINGYGPTEATTFACCYAVEKNRRGATVPIGRPIANTTAYVLNQAMQPVAIGERGELFIGGVGVARGYFNRPDLTAARFVPDPFCGQEGTRLYRTGDLCRYLEDGNIEFLGRLDNQIKLRGLRIELGEIEAELQKYPAVRQAVVLAREDTPGNKRLVAYVAADQGLSGDMLKDYLKDRLPYYMVPATCVVLNALPLNANGKLDKSALPAPDRSFMRSEKALVGARDALEQQLVQMWEEILDIRPIGVQDDFFELGGHSLVAVQLVARIEERLGKRVPMAGLFQEATIERLAQFLREETSAQASSLLVPIQPNGTAPPLFCVHAAGGHVFCYADLSRHLGQGQPLYGIQESPDTDQIAQVQLESLAAEYVRAIRSFRPQGPYFLGGWSLGGVIAFEIARQLEAQGHKPALLALIDAEAPDPKLPEYNWVVLLGSFAFDLGIPAETLRASWSEIATRPPMEQLRRVWMEAKSTGKVPADITLVAFRKLFDSFKAKAHMMRSYAGGVYPGRITLFRAGQPLEYIGEKPPENYYTDVEPTKGWKQWTTDGVEVHTIPGQHYTIMREPHVKALAEQLRICLHDAAKGT